MDARRRNALGAIACAVMGLVVVGPSTAHGDGRPEVRRPSAALTAAWWQAFTAVPSEDVFERCDLGTQHLVFLAGTAGGIGEARSCTMSSRDSMLVPLINVECSTAEGNGTTPPELRSCAESFADDFSDLALTIDGRVVTDLDRLRVGSGPFTFTAAEGNAFGIPAGTTRAVSDGYWALIPPLSVGTHTISFEGTYPPGEFVAGAAYTITVVPTRPAR